jgi:hypothetical protein
MPKFNLSISGLSIGMAIALAVWEVLFFYFGWEGLYSLVARTGWVSTSLG